ncbi:MAG: hypothetical protein LBQ40_04575 [Clostridiales bacterium]|jgi:hypothetical protein|nr:hypothetical protein [Clostridiales bacterium]
MKKYLKVVLITCLLVISGLTLNSCKPAIYIGKNPELHTIVLHTFFVLGEYQFDRIEILETDDYGRTLFSYINSEGKPQQKALLICQKSDKKHTYFYTDYNFMLTDEFILPEEWAEVKGGDLAEEIELLKEKNDWGEELKEELLMKVPIRRYKKSPISDRKLRKAFKSVGEYGGCRYGVYLTEDPYGRCLYIVRSYDDISYVMILSKDGAFDKENFLIEMDIWDMSDYWTPLKEFKERNRWNLPPQ